MVVVQEGGEAHTVNMCQHVGVFYQRRSWKVRRGRGKKEYKVSGSRNPPSERFWSKSEEVWIWDVAPKSYGKALSQ